MRFLKGKFVPQKVALRTLYWRVRRVVAPPAIPKNADGKVYINLGCGDYTGKEFVNVDAVPSSKTHHVSEIESLKMFPDASADMIYASHVVEHLPRKKIVDSFKEWRRVLKPGGVLRIGVPSFDALIEIYQASGKDVRSIENQMMGQEAPYDDHHSIWNFEYAKSLLEAAGFRDVRLWDVATADHHDFKDKTNRAMEVAGRSIPFSLNVEATR